MKFFRLTFSASALAVSGRTMSGYGISASFCQYSTSPILRQTARSTPTKIRTSQSGELGTLDYRLKYHDSNGKISPWHDISLTNGKNVNFLTEIPRLGRMKMEVSTKEAFNPISQDAKNNQPRCYAGPIYWNYGCLPQTWEDPNERDADLNVCGDNDPLDAVEISSTSLSIGSITPVKVLGALAMVDDGELDWKLLTINENDPLYSQLNDISDIERTLPGYISGIREWFRWYKIPDGKPLNTFGFGEQCVPREKALKVVLETHEAWKRLVTTSTGEYSKGGLWIGKRDDKNDADISGDDDYYYYRGTSGRYASGGEGVSDSGSGSDSGGGSDIEIGGVSDIDIVWDGD